MVEPIGSPIRAVLLEELFPIDTIRESNQRQGSAPDMTQNGWRYFQIVFDDFRFSNAPEPASGTLVGLGFVFSGTYSLARSRLALMMLAPLETGSSPD